MWIVYNQTVNNILLTNLCVDHENIVLLLDMAQHLYAGLKHPGLLIRRKTLYLRKFNVSTNIEDF